MNDWIEFALGLSIAVAATGGGALQAEIFLATHGAVSSDDRIERAELDGGGAAMLWSELPLANPTDLAVDLPRGKVYVADGTGGRAIRVLDLGGAGGVSTLAQIDANVSGLALDRINQLVYFTTQGIRSSDDRIMRVNFDGTGLVTLFTGPTAFANPNHLALDLARGKIYVADGTGGQCVKVGNIDGSGSVATVFNAGINVSSLALDTLNQKIYFTTQSATASADRVMRVDYAGTVAVTLYSGPVAFSNPNRLALDLAGGKLYVGDGTGGHSIIQAQLDGSGLAGAVYSAGINVSGLAVVPAPQGTEGDVAPRPGGGDAITVADWVQVGRFTAGLDLIIAPSEFQRADCAPLVSYGDGILSVADWVQSGRYAAGLDLPSSAAGPVGP